MTVVRRRTRLHLSLALLLRAGAAMAQPAGASVDAEYRRGIEQFIAQGRGQEALEHFQPLWESTHEPRMLWQVAVAQNILGQWIDAERSMREVLDHIDDPWVQRNRDGADGLEADLRQVRSHLGVVRVICQPACVAVTVNGAPALDAQVTVNPGLVRVMARRDGAPMVARNVEVSAGERATVHMVFTPYTPRDRCGPDRACAAGQRCRDGDCEAAPATRDDAPAAPATHDDAPRFSVDVGGGGGLALVSGHPTWAERFDYVSGTMAGYTCGDRACPATVNGNAGVSAWLSLTARYRVSSRVALGLGVRLALNASEWTNSAAVLERGVYAQLSRTNPMANLLVMARVYLALRGDGFAAQGWVPSAIFGVGAGQIEPQLTFGGESTGPSAHVVSGFANVHAGVRMEHLWSSGLHVGAEAVMHVMFPLALPNVDVSAVAGFHL